MTDARAKKQDIRPLRILLVNLMPKKIETETQLLRLIGNTPLQVDVELLQTATHTSRNTPSEHLLKFYKTFPEVRQTRFDGMIITGAPVENLAFEEVDYWEELREMMAWSRTHVYSTLHICWGAQAGLYYHFGVPKFPLARKMSGIFLHNRLSRRHMLLRGFDSSFWAPHSRYTAVRAADIAARPDLELLADSPQAGVYIVAARDGRQIFVMGHPEYDQYTLAQEYGRDQAKGLDVPMPCNYFPQDDPDKPPMHRWRSHAHLLYSNWLNYFVYQRTPYDLRDLSQGAL